ncbi:Flp pilus assembly protein CpaB [Amaricoccus sp.]|uniref:Flp pilus assembly protein CpaB n=1 Tax=Amaricoccus sp. TaxID=1872485 RepID=UPI00260E4E0F|nr:Flp pilus assembly protein CpaB [Amaricoccus sp.]HRO11266.1 Flp pilus assembly protein CpaB [Amaricoccus sp.]
MRIFLVILAALIVAGGTGFYVIAGLRPAAPVEVAQAEAPRLRQVFVPATQIPIGTIITPERLSRMDITESALNGEMVVADAAGQEFLAGSVARQVLPQGVPIARSFVVRPGDRGFLAAVLPKGMRAITIPIDAIAGLSGLALPGDRVDLILTYSVSGDGGDGIHASETVLSNLRVLAFDQRLGPEAPPKDKEARAEGAPVAKTATLEVSSRQAEIVTLAQTLGSLSLVLNSVRDGGEPAAKPEALSLDVTPSFLKAAEAKGPARRQTLESDVTSTSKVQIVRGVQIRATATPSDAAASAAGAE